MNNQPIGIFDSGLGGLTVLKQINTLLPHESVIYYGDTARAPYGSKAVETLQVYSQQIVGFLIEEKVKSIVIACNTVSSVGLENLKKHFPSIPIIDIIQPIVSCMPQIVKPNEVVALIGTEVTISSGVYEEKLNELLPECKIIPQACPLFVKLIEDGLMNDRFPDSVIRQYLDEIMDDHKPDYLILACTHYPLIAHRIQKLYPEVKLLDPAFAQVEAMQKILEIKDMQADSNQKAKYKFYASNLSDVFYKTVDTIMAGKTDSFIYEELKF